ncbi:TMV resistance protein N [Senna tora]|uniref:TMV resistance protein N n=1 Tax=Senna tora TaxID=362788 RepID=A0A834XJ24_9FABA|nr:TMV resistance protein N [Senna tora]
MVKEEKWNTFFNLDVKQWVDTNLSKSWSSNMNEDWGATFATSAWLIWKQRNECVFNHKSADAVSLLYKVETEVKNYQDASALNNLMKFKKNHNSITNEEEFGEDWYRLNTDGSYWYSSNNISCGGVIYCKPKAASMEGNKNTEKKIRRI